MRSKRIKLQIKKAGDAGFDRLSHMIVEIIIFGSIPNILPSIYFGGSAFTAPKYILTASNGRNKRVLRKKLKKMILLLCLSISSDNFWFFCIIFLQLRYRKNVP